MACWLPLPRPRAAWIPNLGKDLPVALSFSQPAPWPAPINVNHKPAEFIVWKLQLLPANYLYPPCRFTLWCDESWAFDQFGTAAITSLHSLDKPTSWWEYYSGVHISFSASFPWWELPCSIPKNPFWSNFSFKRMPLTSDLADIHWSWLQPKNVALMIHFSPTCPRLRIMVVFNHLLALTTLPRFRGISSLSTLIGLPPPFGIPLTLIWPTLSALFLTNCFPPQGSLCSHYAAAISQAIAFPHPR